MKWLKRKLRRWVFDEEIGKESAPQLVATRDIDSVQNDPILQFRVFSAVGGKVVEFSRYDRKTDRRDSTNYIITNEQDFGERISKIATMENLKN